MISAKRIQFFNKIIAIVWMVAIIFNSGLVPVLKAAEIEIINENEAVVKNDLDAEAVAGNEDVSDTGGDVDLSSDDASASTELINETNSNTNEIGAPDEGSIEAVVESSNSAQVRNEMESDSLTGGNDVSDTGGDVTVESEGANSSAHLVDIVNTNTTEVIEATSSGEVNLEVENTNTATVENEVELEATSGANLVGDTGGDVEIQSDEAAAIVNLLNFVNTNLTGSEWVFEIIDILGTLTGDVNLLEDFLAFTGTSSIGELRVTNTNDGTLINNVNASAESGGNTVSDTGGDVKISAGDANVLVNLINFLNTNFAGSSWLFSVTNIFGDLLGDIILPGEGSGGPGGSVHDVSVENNNESNTETQINATASSGNNEVSNTGGSVDIENGGTLARANLLEFINTNIFGLDWVFLIVNRFGNWVGNISNGPEPALPPTSNVSVYAYALNGLCDQEGQAVGPLTVENNNKATLINNVNARASTGGNNVNNTGGDISIKSGVARSLVNVVNFVNTNIVGSRWLFGMVNIFGDWHGDLIFAHPDLTIAKTDNKETAELGETLTYTISYQNLGEMPATYVKIVDILPEGVTYVSDTSGVTPSVSGQTYVWLIGNLAGSASGSFEVTVKVNPDLGLGTHHLENQVLIHTCSRESDDTNNSDTDQTTVEVYPDLEVSKDDGKVSAETGDELTYTINYKNIGNFAAAGVTLTDTLPDHVSLVSGTTNWNLGTLAPNESGSVTVKVKIDETMPAGTATLKNTVEISTTTEEPNKANNSASDQTAVSASPDLTVSKDDGKGSANPGDELTYTIEYENVGDAAAEGVVIVDELPDHLTFVSASAGGEKQPDGNIVWHLGSVGAHGLDNKVELKVKIDDSMPSGTTTINNKAKISTTTVEDKTDNNEGTDATDVEAHPVLKITKENDASGMMTIGSSINFKITIENTGNSVAFDVVLKDILRDGAGNEVFPQSWDIGEIAVGEKVIVEYTLKVTEGITEGIYTNTAKAEGKDDRGNLISSNEAQSTIEVRGGIVLAATAPERGVFLGAVLPITGSDDWMLITAAFCLLLAGMLLRNSNLVELSGSNAVRGFEVGRGVVEPTILGNIVDGKDKRAATSDPTSLEGSHPLAPG